MWSKDTELSKLLIGSGADVNAKNVNGFNALMISKIPEITENLIKKGADVNSIDNSGNRVRINSLKKYVYVGLEDVRLNKVEQLVHLPPTSIKLN